MKALHKLRTDVGFASVRVVFFEMEPRVFQEEDEDGEVYFRGPDWEVVNSFGRYVNARLEAMMPQKGTFGKVLSNGSVTGTGGDVASGRADLAANSRFLDPERLGAVDVSAPLTVDEVAVLVGAAAEVPFYMNLTLPFGPLMWGCVLAATVAFPPAWWLAARRRGTLLQRYLRAAAALVLQFAHPRPRPSPRASERWPFLLWVLFTLVVASAYQGALTSFLAVPQYEAAVDSLAEVGRRRLTVFAHPGLLPLAEGAWPGAPPPLASEPDARAAVARVVRAPRAAAALFARQQLAHTVSLCEHVDAQGHPLLHVATEPLLALSLVYEAARGWPLLAPLDRVLGALREAGLLDKWTSDARTRLLQEGRAVPPRPKGDTDPPEPLSTAHLQAAFFLLAFGQAAAAFAFAVEAARARARSRGGWREMLGKCARRIKRGAKKIRAKVACGRRRPRLFNLKTFFSRR